MRRIALRDLALSASRPEDPTLQIAKEISQGDPDPEARLLAVRAIARWMHAPAREAMRSLVERRETDALLAHEARIAWDRIDLASMGRIRTADAGAPAHAESPRPGTIHP